MGDDGLMYRFYHDATEQQLGGCYTFDGVGDFYVMMFKERGLIPSEIRAERVRIVYE